MTAHGRHEGHNYGDIAQDYFRMIILKATQCALWGAHC